MGDFTLILGENGSGKSLFAESLLAQYDDRVYLATMVPDSEENHQRIEKHRRQREHLKAKTLECALEFPDLTGSSVLLEDVSNLLANLMFLKQEDEQDALRKILALRDNCEHLIAVSILVQDDPDFDEDTHIYIKALKALNQELSAQADRFYIMEDNTSKLQRSSL